MRNLLEYPVHRDEVIAYLRELRDTAIEEGRRELLCGDMRPLLLQFAIDAVMETSDE